MVASAVTGSAAGSAFAPGQPLTEILCTTPDSISVAHPAGQTTRERDAALATVADHCGGGYTETRTVNRGAWRIVDARCVTPAIDAPSAAPCVYDDPVADGSGETVRDRP